MKKLFPIYVLLVASFTAAYGQGEIRSVDFKNFTYLAHCLGETPSDVTVEDGEFLEEKQMDGYVDRFSFSVFDIEYGDLTGDRKDEAIVLTVCNTGGTGNFSEGFVYSMKGRKPDLIARLPGGDRADGGLRSTRVEGGLLIVESNETGPEGGACCPQIIVTTQYKVAGGRLVQSGQESRRDIFPTERVTFAKGTSGKTFRLTIPAQEGKRFVVGARAGQTLTVSVDSNKATLRLLEEAEVKYGVNNFLVRLPSTGNYTVEVQNDSDADLAVVVNIKIH